MAFGPALMWKMGGDTTGFNKAVGGAEKRVGRFKKVIKSVGAAMAVTLAVNAFRNLTAEMDATAKTAEKLGIVPEILQEMRYAGDRTGVSINAVDMGMQRFTRRLAEAAKGSGELKSVLDDYNISAVNADGTTRSNVEVLGDLAEVIKANRDPAEQLRIAFKAFDSEGAAMVNTLRNGRDGLEELRNQARETGNVIGGETLAKYEKLNDEIGTIGGSLKGLAAELGGPIASVLSTSLQGWVMLVQGAKETAGAIKDKLLPGMKETAAVSQEAATNIEKVSLSLENMTRAAETLAEIADMRAKAEYEVLSVSEKLAAIRKQEIEVYNNEVKPNERGSKEWAEGMLKITKLDLEYHKLANELDVEGLKAAEAKKAAAAEALEAAAAARALKSAEVEKAREGLTLAEERTAIYAIQTGYAEDAVRNAARLLEIEAAINAEKMKQFDNQVKLQGGLSSRSDSVTGLSTDKLEFVLQDTQSQINDLKRRNRANGNFMPSGTYAGGLHALMYNIQQELDIRRDFQSAQKSGNVSNRFNPFEIERLRGVTGGLSQDETNQRLLADIRDGIDDINRSRPRY